MQTSKVWGWFLNIIILIGITFLSHVQPATIEAEYSGQYAGFSTGHLEDVFKKRIWRKQQKQEIQRLAKQFLILCRLYQFDPAEVLALIHTESSFNPRALSKVGARGLMQVMPRTAKYIAKKAGIEYSGEKHQLYDPSTNIQLGIAYLDYLRERFKESKKYLAAYNLGPTTVSRMVRRKRFRLGKVHNYVTNIQSRAPKYRRAAERI